MKTAAVVQSASAGENTVIERFLAELSRLNGVEFGLVIDPEIHSLAKSDSAGDPALSMMAERAGLLGISVANPRAALADYSARIGLDMRVGPYDAHWNNHANCVIANEMIRVFSSNRERTGSETEKTCAETR